MRVAVVHSFYSSDVPSGENMIVLEQVKALQEAGHDVALFSRSTDGEMLKPNYSLRVAGQTLTGRGPSPLFELRSFAPDIVHVHNLFPNFGVNWVDEWPGPVVTTLHNFRPICANGLLFRDGRTCLDCPEGDHLSAIRHRCYHDSVVATVPLAIRNSRGLKRNRLLERSARIICLSSAAADIYRRYGIADDRLTVIPNGLEDPGPPTDQPPNGRWAVVGRLTAEKGVAALVRIWPQDQDLDIIGAGPEEAEILALNHPRVHLLGPRANDEVLTLLPSYIGVVIPSVCLEMQPTVAIEAMASGVPVLALEGNAAADLAEHVGCGLSYRDASGLTEVMTAVNGERAPFAAAGRRAFLESFSRTAWVRQATALYASTMQEGSL